MADGNFSDIERRVADDRAALARSLDVLTDTLSPDRLKSEAEGYGGEIGRQIWSATKENPAAFALVGAGLALLLTNAGRRIEDNRRTVPDPAAVPPEAAMEGFDERVAAADVRMRAKASGRAAEEPSAHRMRAAIDRGLSKLPPQARERVLRARWKALRAQEEIEHRARKLGRRAESIAYEQPVAVGAAAFGVGALIAALLPSTQTEDRLLGTERDRLMDEAGAALSREIEALRGDASGSAAQTNRREADPSGTAFDMPS